MRIYLEQVKSQFTPALNFKLSIDIQCSHDHPAGKFYNIFHITKGGNFGGFGDRVFAIWQHIGRPGLLFINFNNAFGDHATKIDSDCNDGEWNTYSLTHRQISNNPSRLKLSLRKDGNEIKTHEMDTSRANQLTNMELKVYLSDPWHTAASAYNVKNFFIEEYDEITTTTTTTTTSTTTTTTTTSSTTTFTFVGNEPMSPVKGRVLSHVFKDNF
jgi:hypothetical protein